MIVVGRTGHAAAGPLGAAGRLMWRPDRFAAGPPAAVASSAFDPSSGPTLYPAAPCSTALGDTVVEWQRPAGYLLDMTAIEFTTELTTASTLTVPADVSARLPKSGRVRVLVLTDDDAAAEAALDEAYEAGYRRLPEDVSLLTAILPLTAVAAGEWE
jgi:hypothetical protein